MQFEDIVARQKDQQKQILAGRLEQRRQQIATAETMKEVVADPRWDKYANHIAALKEYFDKSAKGYEMGLAGGEFLEPKQYGKLKVQLAEAKGVSRGLEMALMLIKTLIERGDIATSEIDVLKSS